MRPGAPFDAAGDMSRIASRIAAASAAPARVPGEAELWIFILGDMLVFAVFFTILSAHHVLHPALFDAGRRQLSFAFGLVNTLALLTSSAFVALGLGEAKAARLAAAKRRFVVAAALGALFVAIKCAEYAQKIAAGANPLVNDFYMYYFVFTGVHLLHVAVGLIALALMIRRCVRPAAEPRDVGFLEGAAVYWHMVDVLWVVLFLLIYLI